jgi:hypothetical protein
MLQLIVRFFSYSNWFILLLYIYSFLLYSLFMNCLCIIQAVFAFQHILQSIVSFVKAKLRRINIRLPVRNELKQNNCNNNYCFFSYQINFLSIKSDTAHLLSCWGKPQTHFTDFIIILLLILHQNSMLFLYQIIHFLF